MRFIHFIQKGNEMQYAFDCICMLSKYLYVPKYIDETIIYQQRM